VGVIANEKNRRGFTLIEMMAVVLLGAIMLTVVLPQFGVLSNRKLDQGSDLLRSKIEYARLRASITGKPHQLIIDLEGASYHVEWEVDRPEENLDLSNLDYGEQRRQLIAPPSDERFFEPIPEKSGMRTLLAEPIMIDGIDTPEGWIEEGVFQLIFEYDGTTQPTTIVLSDGTDNQRILEVFPLADFVHVTDGPF
jgi:prepilin-type N-terminal cleavage/methylation domain-containing protein